MTGHVFPAAVRIDATPYREALTEMGALVRADARAKAIWTELDLWRQLGRCDLAVQVHENGAAVTRPSPAFVAALDKMRAVVAEGAVK